MFSSFGQEIDICIGSRQGDPTADMIRKRPFSAVWRNGLFAVQPALASLVVDVRESVPLTISGYDVEDDRGLASHEPDGDVRDSECVPSIVAGEPLKKRPRWKKLGGSHKHSPFLAAGASLPCEPAPQLNREDFIDKEPREHEDLILAYGEALKPYLEDNAIYGDGNCLFRAAAWLSGFGEEAHLEYRRGTVESIESNAEEFREFLRFDGLWVSCAQTTHKRFSALVADDGIVYVHHT